MTMPGGGPHKVAPGQITDDGELTLSLLNGLVKGNGKLDMKEITISYAKWIKSNPFDVGATTRKALFRCDDKKPQPHRPIEEAKKS